DEIAVVHIAGNHANSPSFLAARHVDELIVGDVGIQIQTAGRISSAVISVTVYTCRPAGGVCGREDLLLDARERRLEIRGRSGNLGEALVTRRGCDRSEEQSKTYVNAHESSCCSVVCGAHAIAMPENGLLQFTHFSNGVTADYPTRKQLTVHVTNRRRENPIVRE